MRAASQQDLRGSAAERQRQEDGLQDEHRAARGADVDLMMARAQRCRGEGEHRGGDRGPLDSSSTDRGRRMDGGHVLGPKPGVAAAHANVADDDG